MAPKLSKSPKKSRKTFEDLNEYCLLEIINKLPLKGRFLVRVNHKLRDLVTRNLLTVTGLKIGRTQNNCLNSRHSSLNLVTRGPQNNDFFDFNDVNKNLLKMIFKFCQNIKCIELSAELDLKIIVWIKKQCKRLECLQINNCVINRRISSRQWIQIGDILADNIIHLSINSMTNSENLSEFGLIYLIQNLKLLEEFSFDVNDYSIAKISKFFGLNLKSLKLNKCYKSEINQKVFQTLSENTTNLEKLVVEGYDIRTLDLICNYFPQLKSLDIFFFQTWLNMDSLEQLNALQELSHLKIEFYQNRGLINYLSRNTFPKLLSLNLTGISFTPELFEDFYLYFPNIQTLVLHNCSLLCEDRSDDYRNRQDCNDCKEKVWNHLSKLKHLKRLSINLLPRKDTGFSKSFVWALNDKSFPAIEELDFQWLPYDVKTFADNLLNPLMTFAINRPKTSFKLHLNTEFFEYVSKKRQIFGVKYNVLLPYIPRNVRIFNTYP